MTDLLSDKTMEPRQEDDLVEDAAVYLAERKYPEGCSVNRKRQIRKIAEKFVLNNGELYYQTKKNGQLHVGFCVLVVYTIIMYACSMIKAWLCISVSQ